jgi:perosamine synthetase
MPVYTLGVVAKMDGICKLAKSYNLPVIVDAACALGALYKGESLGKLGDLSVFSFNGNKTVTAGAGGAIVGRNEDLLKRAKHLSTTARASLEYDHDQIGYNYRMTNLQAAVGCAQLENLNLFIDAKIKIRRAYESAFKALAGIKFFPNPSWGKSACWFSGLVLESESLPKVSQVCSYLKEQAIEARSFWKPIHLQAPYQTCPQGAMTLTDSIWNRIVTLPSSTQLKTNEQTKVIEAVKEILK